MSFLDSFEELSLENLSTDSTDIDKRRIKVRVVKKENTADRLNSCRSNPDTFDYEHILKQMKPKVFETRSPEVVDRLMFGYQLSQNKKRFLKQQKDCDEVKSCTFRPVIITPTKRRSFQEFYVGQKQFLVSKNEKIEKIREKQVEGNRMLEVEQSKPVRISPGSRAILEKRNKKDSYLGPCEELAKTVSVPEGYFKRIMVKPPLSKVPKKNSVKKTN